MHISTSHNKGRTEKMEKYEDLSIEVIEFDAEDVITASNPEDTVKENDTPIG